MLLSRGPCTRCFSAMPGATSWLCSRARRADAERHPCHRRATLARLRAAALSRGSRKAPNPLPAPARGSGFARGRSWPSEIGVRLHESLLIALVSTLVGAPSCAPAPRSGAPVDGEPAEAARARRVELTPSDADLWSDEIIVSGALHGGLRAQDCALLVGSDVLPVRAEAAGFSARLKLTPGPHRVSTRC